MNSKSMFCGFLGLILAMNVYAVDSISIQIKKETVAGGNIRIVAYVKADGSKNALRETVKGSGVLRLYKSGSDDPAEETPVLFEIAMTPREYLDRSVAIKQLPSNHPYARIKYTVSVSAPKWFNKITDKSEGEITFGSATGGGPSPMIGPTTVVTESAEYDTILLKNGDTVSGRLLNDTLMVKTSYASLELPRDKIDKIEIEGAGQNIDVIVLRVGDKMSGVLTTQKIRIKLSAGIETEIDKDKIKFIQLRKSSNN